MPMPSEADAATPETAEVSRRTWLAAERTWLAWWRNGLGAAAVALAVGRIVPDLSRAAQRPFSIVGLGYGVLAVGVLVAGALRQRQTAGAMRRGGYIELPSFLVLGLTAGAVPLLAGAVILVAVRF